MRSRHNPDPRIIILSMRLYGWLLRLGPKEFRQEYGQEILKDFRHCCHNAYMQKGICGVLQLWPSMFAKAIVDMGAEHISEAAHRSEAVRREKKSLPLSKQTYRSLRAISRRRYLILLSYILVGISLILMYTSIDRPLTVLIGSFVAIIIIVLISIIVAIKNRVKGPETHSQ